MSSAASSPLPQNNRHCQRSSASSTPSSRPARLSPISGGMPVGGRRWLLMSILGLIWVYQVDKKVGMDKVAENQIALSPKQAAKLDQLSPDQRASTDGDQRQVHPRHCLCFSDLSP